MASFGKVPLGCLDEASQSSETNRNIGKIRGRAAMDAYKQIEGIMAEKYGKPTTTRKAIGDFMLADDHAVNVKSNNVEKANYSPNMISIKKMHEWVFEERKKLSFLFVDYSENDKGITLIKEVGPVPIEHISWDCLSIEAQGYGVIQKIGELKIDKTQTKAAFYQGFLEAYKKYMGKEKRKHERFSQRFITNVASIAW